MKQALLVAGCLLATTTLFAQTEKGDWAQFGRYAEANKTVKVPSNVVFMGNSITDGWWPADSTFFIRNNFVDRGISGQTTSEMLVRFRQDVINLKPAPRPAARRRKPPLQPPQPARHARTRRTGRRRHTRNEKRPDARRRRLPLEQGVRLMARLRTPIRLSSSINGSRSMRIRMV